MKLGAAAVGAHASTHTILYMRMKLQELEQLEGATRAKTIRRLSKATIVYMRMKLQELEATGKLPKDTVV